jgi:hypothetical protein
MGFLSGLFGGRKDAPAGAGQDIGKKLERQLFPGGQQDIDRFADVIVAALPGKVSREEAQSLVPGLKVVDHISEDRSDERLLVHLRPKTPALTDPERMRLIRAVIGDGRQPLDPSADGSSAEKAIKIDCVDAAQGIDAEYRFLQRLLGPQNLTWKLVSRAHGARGPKYLEWFVVQPKNGPPKTIYFDITSFSPIR